MSDQQPMNPAPTPRADEVATDTEYREDVTGCSEAISTVPADFARTLERELTSAQAALAAKDAEIARLKAHDHFVQKQQVEPAIARAKEAYTNRSFELLNMTARAEKAEAELVRLKSENESLRTLWTEARDVVTQGRNANCVVSYGKAQCDAVAAANAWLDKMPATVKRTIDDASNTEWQLQRVTAERDALRADNDRLYKELAWGSTHMADLRAQLAAAQGDTERLDWLSDNPIHDIGFGQAPGTIMFNGEPFWSLRAAIDAAREAQP